MTGIGFQLHTVQDAQHVTRSVLTKQRDVGTQMPKYNIRGVKPRYARDQRKQGVTTALRRGSDGPSDLHRRGRAHGRGREEGSGSRLPGSVSEELVEAVLRVRERHGVDD